MRVLFRLQNVVNGLVDFFGLDAVGVVPDGLEGYAEHGATFVEEAEFSLGVLGVKE